MWNGSWNCLCWPGRVVTMTVGPENHDPETGDWRNSSMPACQSARRVPLLSRLPTATYFAAVGKRDNNGTRLALWQAGIDEFRQSPVSGSWFSGPTVIVTTRPGQHKQFQLPFHNDYILFLVEGGLIGLGLLLAWAISTELLMLRRYRAYVALGEHSRAALLRTLLIGFNAFFVAAAFNPLFTGMSSSATIFSIYGLMLLLGSPSSIVGSGVQAAPMSRSAYRPFRQPLPVGAKPAPE